MPTPYVFTNTTYQAGFFGTDDGAASANFRIDDVYAFSAVVNGTVNNPGDTITVTFDPGGPTEVTKTLIATNFDNAGMIEFTGTGLPGGSTDMATNRYIFSNTQMFGTGDPNRTRFTAVGTTLGDYDQSAAPCFASGTHIRVVRDGGETEVVVENLRVGDQAVTASGRLRPITWIGHRVMDSRRLAARRDDQPIRVAAHAFGADLPKRDLFLSPGHPVLVGADENGEGGHLVPIMCLVNGTTIERVSLDSVVYWHIELDAHDILLAEGLPAESYLDWGDRPFFSEADEHALMNPDFVVPGLAGRCRPVALDGAVVETERRRLDALFATRLHAASAWPSQDIAAKAW